MVCEVLRDAAVKAAGAELDIRILAHGFAIEGRRTVSGKLLSYRKMLTFEEGCEGSHVWDVAISHTAEALRRGQEEAVS